MKSLSEILLEKLRVSKTHISKPELISRNVVSCTMEFFFKWIIVLDPDKSLTQVDFEDFEVLEDDHLRSAFKTYENLFKWYEDNKKKIKLSKATRKTVEEILEKLEAKLIKVRRK